MKKIIGLVLLLSLIVGCGASERSDDKTINILATSIPHAEILEEVKPKLKKKGITLNIKITDEYYIPNKSVDSGDVDANFFQHTPFLEEQIKEHKYDVENAGDIHIEPIGIYSNKFKKKEDIKDGATVVLSNSVADHGRILSIIEKAGLIKLDSKVEKVSATIKDIKENTKKLKFKADVAPEFASKVLKNNEADLVAINSNFALEADIKPLEDSIILEETKDNPYVNIVVTKKGHKDDKKIKILVDELKSKETKDFILEKYKGAVIVAD